ncbi:MAG: hypothetical protein ACWA6X_11965 [Bauldia sp.]
MHADTGEVSAIVVPERAGAGPEWKVWFRRERPSAGYEAFVAACYLLAMQHGERRVAVDGPLDHALAANLRIAGGYAAHWWGWRPPEIEASEWVAATGSGPAASYFTGGVDSMFTLHRNLREFPPAHPWRIRRALLSYGFDAALGGDNYASDDERRSFGRLTGALAACLDHHGVALEVVDTNVRRDFDYGSFIAHLHGGFLAAMAHARPGMYFLPSTHAIPELIPFGSHPDIDPNMSSAATRIVHDGHEVTRLRKIELLQEWGADLSALHVCWDTPAVGPLNCGRCRKCRRTVFELVAIGADELVAAAFPDADPAEIVATMAPVSDTDVPILAAAAAAFRTRGRPALAVEAALRRRGAARRRVEERDWRGPPKRLLRRLGLR